VSRSPMVSPEAARSEARRRLVTAHRGWTLDGWSAPVWSLPLRPPTEREVLADPATAERWVRQWRGTELPDGVSLAWESRSWRSVGTQQVPVRVLAESPDALARLSGGPAARDWRAFAERVHRIRNLASGPQTGHHDPPPQPSGLVKATVVGDAGNAVGATQPSTLLAAVRRHAERLTSLPEVEFDRLLAVVEWLGAHSVTGLRPRQLPIRGVDSKWFGTHRTVVTALHDALFAGGTGTGLGIVDADPTVRMHILDPALRPGGLRDLEVPVDQAARISWRPQRALIVENRETLLCLPDARGVVALWGKGFDATSATALPWLRDLPIIYWGDLDSQGFAILHRYRSHLPQIESLLMDEATLEEFSDLWVPEPKPARRSMSTLQPSESRTLERLRAEGDIRLEQERIPWTHALNQLTGYLPKTG
jgi:hypothetical protein